VKKNNTDLEISTLGKATVTSPIALANENDKGHNDFVNDNQFVRYYVQVDKTSPKNSSAPEELLEKAGPRKLIYFDHTKVHAGIVTCGGLCPGLNDVIRSIVMTLWYRYGVKRISGFRFGYRGLIARFQLPVIELIPNIVSDIHCKGGSILGASRGHGNCTDEIVNTLERMNISMLFVIGGDGSQKGALDIATEIKKRKLKIAVIGIPKTIDNDLNFVEKTFGFETAVSKAVDAVASAHVEAQDAVKGVVVVKVMGRDSGFIAAHTALAMNDVNYVLIPEVPFDLEGGNGLLANLERRLIKRNHAVILAAEGAGQKLFDQTRKKDASGNKKLGDIGVLLKDKINDYFQEKQMEINLKYIDPSYMIRSAPANPNDSIYCARLGSHAVHAAMAGKTTLLISLVHSYFVHVPIRMAVSSRKRIDPNGGLWRDVTEATGQPIMLTERRDKNRNENKTKPTSHDPVLEGVSI